MKDFHVTRDFLAALERGEIAHSKAVQLMVEHVLALCPVCRRERDAFHLECELGAGGLLAVADPLLTWLVTVAPDFEGRKRQAEESARRDLRDLLALAPEARPVRIERSRRRFRRPELVELLLGESQDRIRAAPWEAHELAQLALEVTWQIEEGPGGPPRHEVAVLRARCLVHSGNSLRVQGHLAAAEREFGAARELVGEADITELAVLAELDWLEGVLRGALGQVEAAVRQLDRAIVFYELAGDRHRAAVTRFSLGALHQEHAQPERAAAAIYPILDALDEQREPLLVLAAHHNLTLCLCDLGRFADAHEIFHRSQHLYARFDDFWTRLRRRWAEARIGRGVGRPEYALALLREVRDGFLDQDLRLDAARASREMAEIQREAGRPAEAVEAARYALDVFAAQGMATDFERTATLVELLEHEIGGPRSVHPELQARTEGTAGPRPGDVHVMREILRAQGTSRLDSSVVTRMYVEHLLALCPHCSSEGPSAGPRGPAETATTAQSHGAALRRIALRVPHLVGRVRREELKAKRRLRPLLALPAAERLRAIEEVPAGPAGFALAEMLLASAQGQLEIDLTEALSRVGLARSLAARLVPTSDGPPPLAVAELRARAELIAGDALRRAGELRSAERCLSAARAATRGLGVLDPGLSAELDFGEAQLRRDQERWPAAVRLFRRAAVQYRSLRSGEDALRAQVEHGATLCAAGETEKGLESLLEAIAALDPQGAADRALAVKAHRHAAAAYVQLGRESDARRHDEAAGALVQPRTGWSAERLADSRAAALD